MWDKYINTILLTWGVWFYILSLIYVLHLVLLLKMHATWMYHPQVLQNVYVVLLNSPNRNGVLKWVETDSRSPKRVGTMSSNRGCQEHKDLWSNPNLKVMKRFAVFELSYHMIAHCIWGNTCIEVPVLQVILRIKALLSKRENAIIGISASEAAQTLRMAPALAKEQLLTAENKGKQFSF